MALAGTQTPDAPDYRNRLVFDTIRHQLPVIVIVGVLGLLAGFAFSLAHPPVYTSSASVLINPLEGNPYSPDSQGDSLVALETEAQIVSSDEVTKETAALLKDGSTLDVLQKGVSALVQPNTQIIQISFTSKSATFAQRAAQAYADSYLEYRRQRSNDVNDAAIRSLKQQSKDVRGQLNAVEDRIDSLPAGPERDFQSGLRDTYRARLIELDSQVAQLTSGIAEAGRAISPAAEPKSPSGVGSIVYAAGGLLAGLLGGFVLALARERRSDHLYRPEDVDAAGVPVLARLSSHKSVVDAESREAIRRIRAAVVSLRAPRNIVAVTCCSPRAAEPGVAALLSDSLWKGGSSVVLVNGADNEPDPTGIFPHAAGPGLSDALLDRSLDASRMLVEVDPALRLLPRGRHGDEAVEHFLPKQLTEVVQLLDVDAEYVILRSPPISESGGEAMVSISAATVLLVTLGKTTYSELAAATATVRREQGKLLGAVIVPAGRKALRGSKRSKRTRSSGGPKGRKAEARTVGKDARESDLADRTSRR